MSSSAEAALERKAAQMVVPLPQVEQDPLPCPRCSSNNTKFCYYNNYNFSQPRHFCKSCRRYWTHGGTLRDVPVGGGSRKSAKRSRTSASISPCSAAAVTSTASSNYGGGGGSGGSMGSNFDALPTGPLFTSAAGGGFTSLLSLGGLGLGLELEDVGFEMGRSGGGVWPFPEVGFVNDATGGGNGGGDGGCENRGMDTWRMEIGVDNHVTNNEVVGSQFLE